MATSQAQAIAVSSFQVHLGWPGQQGCTLASLSMLHSMMGLLLVACALPFKGPGQVCCSYRNEMAQHQRLCDTFGCLSGAGANPISTSTQYAIATDECPECLTGALDLSQDGDGRWGISWYPVQCDVGSTAFQYSFAGSNAQYVKMAITNTRYSMHGDLTCTGAWECIFTSWCMVNRALVNPLVYLCRACVSNI